MEFYYVDENDTRVRRLVYSYMFTPDSTAKYNTIGATEIAYYSMNLNNRDLVYVKYMVDTLTKIDFKYPNYEEIGPGMTMEQLNK